MISPDTSSLVSFFAGSKGKDIDLIDSALEAKALLLTPAVLSEILSDKKLPKDLERAVLSIPMLDLEDGYWQRVGYLRRIILKSGQKARLADALIAQACIDHKITLVTRDQDFKAFKVHSNLSVQFGP